MFNCQVAKRGSVRRPESVVPRAKIVLGKLQPLSGQIEMFYWVTPTHRLSLNIFFHHISPLCLADLPPLYLGIFEQPCFLLGLIHTVDHDLPTYIAVDCWCPIETWLHAQKRNNHTEFSYVLRFR